MVLWLFSVLYGGGPQGKCPKGYLHSSQLLVTIGMLGHAFDFSILDILDVKNRGTFLSKTDMVHCIAIRSRFLQTQNFQSATLGLATAAIVAATIASTSPSAPTCLVSGHFCFLGTGHLDQLGSSTLSTEGIFSNGSNSMACTYVVLET